MAKLPYNTEIKILQIITKENREMTSYEITKIFYNLIEQKKIISRNKVINKALQRLSHRGILNKKNSYPVFYKINKNYNPTKMMNYKLYEIVCPKCKKIHKVTLEQKTKQCSCLKENGKNRRFWITQKRYVEEETRPTKQFVLKMIEKL